MTADSALEELRRLFEQQITVREITSSLVSFDDCSSATSCRDFMKQQAFDVVGVRQNGLVQGYVRRTDLLDGTIKKYNRPISQRRVMRDSDPLRSCLRRLVKYESVFVRMVGHIGGIVTRSDLHRPPVRLWLFGLVTLTEMSMTDLVKKCYPDDKWKKRLNEDRISEAEKIFKDRNRRNEEITRIDCLQFCDKYVLLLKQENGAERLGLGSNTKAKTVFKKLRKLRDDLAHGHHLDSRRWAEIAGLAETAEQIIDRISKEIRTSTWGNSTGEVVSR